MGTFKKGMFLGGLFGAGLMWLNVTKEGKVKRDILLDHARELTHEIKEKITSSSSWQDMSQSHYVTLVTDVVEKYAVKHGLAEQMKRVLIHVLGTQWKTVKKEMPKAKKKKNNG